MYFDQIVGPFAPKSWLECCRDEVLNFGFKLTYKPYTLVGPTVTRPVQDPLAVTHLENQLSYMHV